MSKSKYSKVVFKITKTDIGQQKKHHEWHLWEPNCLSSRTGFPYMNSRFRGFCFRAKLSGKPRYLVGESVVSCRCYHCPLIAENDVSHTYQVSQLMSLLISWWLSFSAILTHSLVWWCENVHMYFLWLFQFINRFKSNLWSFFLQNCENNDMWDGLLMYSTIHDPFVCPFQKEKNIMNGPPKAMKTQHLGMVLVIPPIKNAGFGLPLIDLHEPKMRF